MAVAKGIDYHSLGHSCCKNLMEQGSKLPKNVAVESVNKACTLTKNSKVIVIVVSSSTF